MVRSGAAQYTMVFIGLGAGVCGVGFAQLAHLSSFEHPSLICPYFWHLLHLIGSCASLRTMTQVFAIKILSRRRWLAMIGDEQIT